MKPRTNPQASNQVGHLIKTLALVLLVCSDVMAAQSMWDLFPGNGKIAGWQLVPGAEQKAGTIKGLYGMYDGAVPEMTKAGIIAAGQRIYAHDGHRLTVDLFRFRSIEQAKAYYVKRKSEISKASTFAPIAGIRDAGCSATISRSSVAYVWRGHYYGSLSINGNTTADGSALQAFARYITTHIAPTPTKSS